jgi:2-octaprenyl-6-methoxyphenol hydroxylase
MSCRAGAGENGPDHKRPPDKAQGAEAFDSLDENAHPGAGAGVYGRLAMVETSTVHVHDVAVVGGGLVGGALAIALARHGLDVVLVDKLAPAAGLAPTFDGRASAVALAGQRLLAAIGLWDDLAADAEPIREIRVSDGPSLLFLHYDHADVGPDPLGFMIENRRLRRAIAGGIAGAGAALTVMAPAAVNGFEQDADEARLLLARGGVVRARLAIAAEGRASVLRDAAGIRTSGWDYDQTAIVATIGHDMVHAGIAHERFLAPGPFAILPLKDGHRSSLVWTETAAAARDYLTLPDDRFLAEIADRVGGFLGRLHLIGPRFSYPLGLQLAESYVRGRLVLVGDTAHGIHPIAGQGLNLGLRDVAALTEVLVDGARLGLDPAHGAGLQAYQRWRRADNLLMSVVTDGLNRLFSTAAGPVRAARDVGLAAVNRLPPLKNLLMKQAMGVVGELPRLMTGKSL